MMLPIVWIFCDYVGFCLMLVVFDCLFAWNGGFALDSVNVCCLLLRWRVVCGGFYC